VKPFDESTRRQFAAPINPPATYVHARRSRTRFVLREQTGTARRLLARPAFVWPNGVELDRRMCEVCGGEAFGRLPTEGFGMIMADAACVQ
jgi:hypothetical protein